MATAKKSTRPTPKAQDAIALLRADHRLVSELFEQFEKSRSATKKKALVQQICTELTVHAQVEEEIFYPAVRAAIQETEIIAEAAIEHATLKTLIGDLEQGQPGDEEFEATVKVLGEYVAHHVAEEQTEIFPRARASDLDLQELGARLLARKAELMSGDGEGVRSEGRSTGATDELAEGMSEASDQ